NYNASRYVPLLTVFIMRLPVGHPTNRRIFACGFKSPEDRIKIKRAVTIKVTASFGAGVHNGFETREKKL
ncbi:MAG: hypothetical protein UHT63_06535, partial [Acutalibacteraceae bacterium]|nr:hypothetical protein [Acutalibacteraceae bacterium]